jgi:hypothetical protein
MRAASLTPALIVEDEAAALWAAAARSAAEPSPVMSQQLSPETAAETSAAAPVWQATVRDGADVVLTQQGPLLQVLTLAVVIGQFWPALRVCVRRQQHRAPRPGCAA